MSVLRSSGVVAAVAVLTLAAGCAQEEGDGTGTGTGTGDPQLRIGYVLPETGGIAFLGPGMIGSVKIAVEEINEAGGVNGEDVVLTGGDEGGADGIIASQTVDRLLNTDRVSAVIGAAASGVSLKVIDKITQAGVVQCAPSNTSPTFTDYEDNGFYFRAAPSDALLAPVFGDLVTEEGGQRVAMLGRADDYGQSLIAASAEAVQAAGGETSEPILYDPTTQDFDAEVRAVAAYQPDAMVLIAFDETAAILRNLTEAGYGPQDIRIYGGTGSKKVGLAEQVDPGNPASVQGLRGINPAATSDTGFLDTLREEVPDLAVTQYTGESYDCTMLVALAAQQAGSSDPSAVRDNMVSVSKDGTKCTTFAECKELLEADEDIDYDGVSGPIDLTEVGDPSKATYDEWEFQADGSITTLRSVESG